MNNNVKSTVNFILRLSVAGLVFAFATSFVSAMLFVLLDIDFRLAIAVPAIVFGTPYTRWVIHTRRNWEDTQDDSSDDNPPNQQLNDDILRPYRFFSRNHGFALLASIVAFGIVLYCSQGSFLNLLAFESDNQILGISIPISIPTPYFEFDNESFNNVEFPSYLLQDEITHYFYAREVFSGGLSQFVQLALDEWARPGNTLMYALPSSLGFIMRRVLSAVLLILTTVETIWIFQALSRPKKMSKVSKPVRIFSYFAIPILLWSQPWFFYYGMQSLTQVPFMYFLTAGVSAWLFGRYRRATFFFSLMPITRHESLPLLLIWLVYLYRRETFGFVLNNLNGVLDIDLQQPNERAKDPKQYYLKDRWKLIIIALIPYAIWNFGSLAFRNSFPLQSLTESRSEIAYEAQNFELFFIAAGEWMGPFVLILFLSAIVLLAILGYVQWTYITAIRPHKDVKKNPLLIFIKQRDAHLMTTPLSRYLWWTFYLGYFLIHVVVIIRPSNPFASGGYDFFILPIAPALAVIASLFIPLAFGALRFWNQHNNQFFPDIREALDYFKDNYEGDMQIAMNDEDGDHFLRNRSYGGTRFFARFSVRLAVASVVFIGLTGFTYTNNDIWISETERQWYFIDWIPEGQEIEGPDGEMIGVDAGERQAVVNQINAINDLISEPDLWLPDGNAENVLGYTPFVLTTNSALRLAMEQASTNEDGDSDTLSIDNTNFRLCPRVLWDVNPRLPLYPNLLPDDTVIIADGRTDSGFQTNYMVMHHHNPGYRLEIHHLSTMFSDYSDYFGTWEREELEDSNAPMNQINLDVAPTNNTGFDYPRYWINYGFAIYRLNSTTMSNTNETLLYEHDDMRVAYAERYCGYAESERFAEVTTHYQPLYENIGNLFPNSTDALSSLELPSDAVIPLLDDCTIQEAVANLAGCEVSLADVAYIMNHDDELQMINPDSQVNEDSSSATALSSNPLFVPPDSMLPVLYCQKLDRRLQASWCLTVFGDTAFAIDADSELSYTSNTLAPLEDRDTSDVCNFNRLPTTAGTWDERIVLPDVASDLLIRTFPNNTRPDNFDLHWRERSDGTYISYEDNLLFAEYPFSPRWLGRLGDENDNAELGEAHPIAEASPIITMPGCFGWTLVYRPGSRAYGRSTNTLLIDEHLEDLRRDESLPLSNNHFGER
ncbi:MAG: hypothetical protein Phog2KO_20850 [Phototrophicaceae bacterium]